MCDPWKGHLRSYNDVEYTLILITCGWIEMDISGSRQNVPLVAMQHDLLLTLN